MPVWKAGSPADKKLKDFLVDGAFDVDDEPADNFKDKKKLFEPHSLDQFRRARKRVVAELGKLHATHFLALFQCFQRF